MAIAEEPVSREQRTGASLKGLKFHTTDAMPRSSGASPSVMPNWPVSTGTLRSQNADSNSKNTYAPATLGIPRPSLRITQARL